MNYKPVGVDEVRGWILPEVSVRIQTVHFTETVTSIARLDAFVNRTSRHSGITQLVLWSCPNLCLDLRQLYCFTHRQQEIGKSGIRGSGTGGSPPGGVEVMSKTDVSPHSEKKDVGTKEII